jgi:hypothetical protein
MSTPRSSLDPTLVQAAVAAARERLPADTPLTLEALEDAVLAVFHDLGPAMADALAAPTPGPQKRGRRRSAAGSPSAGSGGDAAGS